MKLPKHRAWDRDDKKMWKVVAMSESIYGDCEDSYIKVCEFDKSPRRKETDIRLLFNFDLMRCTGLYDKNGKEIYEGDIVKFHFPNPYNTVVKFKNGHFAFYKGKRMMVDPYYYTNHVWSYAEVIGNIYEHKHLLG